MTAYIPENWFTVFFLPVFAVGVWLLGCRFNRFPASLGQVICAWILTLSSVVGVERSMMQDPPGARMVAIILALFFGMKLVVLASARFQGGVALTPWRWSGFLFGWPCMLPGLFAKTLRPNHELATRLAIRGGLFIIFGAGCMLVANQMVSNAEDLPWNTVKAGIATLILLIGISLILHFGVFNLLAAGWQLVGIPCHSLFRAPLASASLTEFWSRRWNLAFSEMTSIAIYRPCRKWFGPSGALFLGFVFSGLAHELAISVPIGSNYGGPLSYFLLHGVLLLLECRFDLPDRFGNGYRLWILFWLSGPLPILFPPGFLREIVWQLAGFAG